VYIHRIEREKRKRYYYNFKLNKLEPSTVFALMQVLDVLIGFVGIKPCIYSMGRCHMHNNSDLYLDDTGMQPTINRNQL